MISSWDEFGYRVEEEYGPEYRIIVHFNLVYTVQYIVQFILQAPSNMNVL